MANFRVRVGANYIYKPNLLDIVDGRTGLTEGTEVKVINVHGCPKANVMGHCYVGDAVTGKVIGMVSTNSLHTTAEYIEYLKSEIAKKETVAA